MKKAVFISVFLAGLFLVLGALVGPSLEADQKGKAQTLCPITGQPITKSSYLDYEGERIHFCCDDCKSAFLKDPGRYVNKMKSDGIALEAAPMSKGAETHHHQGGHHEGAHP